MIKKFLALSLVLVIVLPLTACGGNDYPPAEEVVDSTAQAMASISTCQFELDVSIDIDGEAEDESYEATVAIDSSGALDIENNQMQLELAMNAVVEGEGETDLAMELYLIDDMAYLMVDIPGAGASWGKLEVPAEYWEQMTQVEPQVELLEAGEVKVTGSETVNGTACYVVEITPDMEQLWEMASQQAALSGEMPDFDEEFLDEAISSFSVKQWIAKDSYLIMKAEVNITLDLTTEAMSTLYEEGEGSLDIALTLLIDDYNQPVSIELPAEAEEATEIPMDSFPFDSY